VLGTGGALGAVQDAASRLHAYATTYYQSARTSGQATPVTVQSGEARTGVDITLHLLRAFTVAGRVVTPDGQLAGLQMRLTPTDTGGPSTDSNNALVATDAEGSFVFFGVPSGRYLLETSRTTRTAPPPAPETTTWARVPLTVGASDITGLTVVTQPGLTVSGRVDFESNTPQSGSRLLGATFSVESDGFGRMTSSFSIAGPITQFATRGLRPGRYRTFTEAPPGWAVKSVMSGGIDIADAPLELENSDVTDVVITLTDRPSTIGGTVRTAGNPDPSAVVLMFPSDTRFWQDDAISARRLASLRTTPKGTFGPVNLPSGNYCVIATADEFGDDWQDPRVLELLARTATRVTLGDAQQLSVELSRATLKTAPTRSPDLAYPAYGAYLAYRGFQVRDTRVAAPPKAAGIVSGVVLANDASNRPIVRARVALRPIEGRQDFATITDATGRFAFGSIPSGRYTMTVTKPAYLTAYYGTGEGVLPPGLPIAVDEGKPVSGLTLRLVPGGVITGTIVDEHGQPMSNARIQVLQPFGSGTDRRLATLVIQGAPFTDDRGVFRIYGLQAGKYAVAALQTTASRPGMDGGDLRLASTSNRPVSYAPVYYPGTMMSSDAAFVEVASGRETSGIDIVMRLVPTARVEGTGTRADGQPVSGIQVQVFPRDASQLPTTQSTGGHTPADGLSFHFVTNNVPPGQYVVTARATDRRPPATLATPGPVRVLWAQQDVDVNGEDVSGITLVLQPALTITGRVAFEGTTMEALFDAKNLRVILTATGAVGAGAFTPTPLVNEAGRFTIPNVVPGRYTLAVSALSLVGNAPTGIWSLVSAMAGGRDLLDYPLEVRPGEPVPEIVVTYANQTAELSGRLLDAAGKPMRDLSIVLFSTDRAVWSPGSRRVRAPVRPADDGSFRFLNLPPGEYFLGAVTDVDPKQAGDPALLEQLAPAAIRISIGAGEKKTQDLRIAGRPLAFVPAAPSARR